MTTDDMEAIEASHRDKRSGIAYYYRAAAGAPGPPGPEGMYSLFILIVCVFFHI